MTEYRVEHDTMGEVRVPSDALWGAQTQRAVENFPISGTPLPYPLIIALAQIKEAAAQANADTGVLDRATAEAIAAAARQVIDGDLARHFPVDVFQTGSGTSTNMNLNEVLARLAGQALGRPVHPNDQVNASQSSNDVFPSGIHLAALRLIADDLRPALLELHEALKLKAAQFAHVVKSGRTHLMDATPVTLGQEFSGYAQQVQRGAERVASALPHVAELPLGGTAVGTGVNASAAFRREVYAHLVRNTGLPVREAENHFEAHGSRDALVELSGQLRAVAVSLYKIANDIRWMGSGPRAGLSEVHLPDLQPGSSIMPGKVNPVLCESVRQVCAQVIGADATIAFAGSQGDFELNTMLPVIARNLLESITLLAGVSRVFAQRCVLGLTANEEICRLYAEGSPSIVTPLNRHIGYEEAAAIAKQALAENKTIRQVVVERGHVEAGRLSEAELDAALDVLAMTRTPD
ncbi:fumarate hydratase class II [Catellatospora sp. TT07R-123]|uniref:class II fumarate hydratase n=1 Tax=Catellatospora sp. TT07R-123 TaxID=2733863 RepID=UPI001B25C9C3|nr:class II fumarate hydratase [Catellatospora sp. TT07R-123]GHJ46383.1 fumarate hydratase class II [Catellatospora sp. TT07R-123]